MSKPEMDLQALQAIKEKLINQQRQYGAAAPEASVDWSYPRTAQPPFGETPSAGSDSTPSASYSTVSNTAAAAQASQLANAVETLQQRSAQSLPSQFVPQAPDASTWAADVATQISIHQMRLQAIVDQINELSAKQERAMVEMKTVAERLDLEQRRQQRFESSAGLSLSVPLEVNYESAILAAAEQDEQGNIMLTYRMADLHQADREANHLAQTLRNGLGPTYRNRHSQSNQFASAQKFLQDAGIATLLAEPMATLQSAWNLAYDLALTGWDHLRAAVATPRSRQRSSPFTLLDGVIWLGGGVISRLALNLILTAYPALWSVAVAAVTGMTAYALYRATLAPRLDFGLAYRVLLAVAGLIVGGRLF
ncbi:MAG TPA: hypothetical protein V6D06_18990 [Trichocoleus sp.]